MILGLTGIVQAETAVNESRPLAADGTVEIDNISGRITVAGWSGNTVEITGTIDSGVEELDISSGGSRLSISVELERHTRKGGNAYLTIKMPSTANLDVETVSADISVEGVRGELELESVSGDVKVSGETRSLEAASVSGEVVAVSTAGRSELESVSGNVIIRNATGRIDAAVVSGNIEIEGSTLEMLDAESVSGSISCTARPAESGRFSLETMSGTVEMSISPDWNVDYYVETYSGAIRNSMGPEPQRTDKYGPGKELRFSTGSGGARVTIESFSGSVRLRTD
jgi:DUF4097 and DUF4098 domain-containing protein YvlB